MHEAYGSLADQATKHDTPDPRIIRAFRIAGCLQWRGTIKSTRGLMTHSISVRQINKSFGDFVAVDNLSLEIREGSIFGLLGPNGAGKTTTIRMLVNITMPDSGEITLFGQGMSPKLQERVGYLPEDRGLYKKMKVSDQLSFFAALKGMNSADAAKKIDQWLDRIDMKEWKNKRWDELSKGMQQKIQFVSTILHDPDLVILDEPFSGLDPINARLLTEIVQEMKARKKTIIFSTHLMSQAEELCDSICLINRGRKLLDGPIREIKRNFGSRVIAIDGEGFENVIQDPELVSSVEQLRDRVEVVPATGIDPQTLLQRLVSAGAFIRRFEMVEPSLNEIFIESVSRMNETLPDKARHVPA
jgi:ABC-2 type transport system ATP-binding protein